MYNTITQISPNDKLYNLSKKAQTIDICREKAMKNSSCVQLLD